MSFMQGRVNTKYPSMAPNRILAFAYQGKDIVFKFILEYSSSLRDFDP
jgi:hypothetical protein